MKKRLLSMLLCTVLLLTTVFVPQMNVRAEEGNDAVGVTAGSKTAITEWSDLTSAEGCTFASSDPSVAWVDAEGTLRALKAGTTTVTVNDSEAYDVTVAKYDDGSEVVGALKLIVRFNDSMNFIDGHAYLAFTSYQDGVTFSCDQLYAAYDVSDQYYEDIAEDIGNGSHRTGTDTDQYFTCHMMADDPIDSITLDRGEIITIGNYRGFDLTVKDAALATIMNSTAFSKMSDSSKATLMILAAYLASEDHQITEEDIQQLLALMKQYNITDITELCDGTSEGGICYNRELYNQKLEYDQFENVTYQVDITEKQLEKLQQGIAEVGAFSLLNNSCATAAANLWNMTLGEDSAYVISARGDGVYAFAEEPMFLRQSVENNLPGYKTNKLDSVEDETACATTDGVSYYVTAPAKLEDEEPAEPVDYDECKKDRTCVYAKFTDASTTAWYHDGVHFCVQNGLMNGTSSKTFQPDAELTRGMLVTILWRMAGSPVVNYAMSFTDVAADTWYTEAVRWAQANGIVTGYSDTSFAPNEAVTREQIAAILYRYAAQNGESFDGASEFQFNPVDAADISDWAAEAMRWCYMKKILTGDETGALRPTGNATRAETAAMLQRFCERNAEQSAEGDAESGFIPFV